ncbi:BNR repeat-containing protein [Pedobacter sp. AW31-3R]|uniref:BNR repeat-containing protein n=1 Tax=Pedobacter sp. AW31-3R TaxID=3445781 RepID=UPI003FA0EA95
MKFILSSYFLLILFLGPASAQQLSTVGNGWAGNSVNAVVFRKNAVASFKGYQYIAYYDQDKNVVLGKRKNGHPDWVTQKTQYTGAAEDAHRSISLIVDGDGFLHISWDHHGTALKYAKSVAPGSLKLSDQLRMTGQKEKNVTYPEFYTLANGDLLFLYRDGSSGNGNLMLNRYSVKTKTWTNVQDGFIDGEGKRNAYPQMAIDQKGVIHISWVWRESADVSSNHDMSYARSADGGQTWQKSTGESYVLPITLATAECAVKIPQQSELINQTSMYADASGNPFIASYWREAGEPVPQYHVIYKTGKDWQVLNLGFRKTAFSLSGVGTKSIPVSRPQIIAWQQPKEGTAIALLFRDQERNEKITVAVNRNLKKNNWVLKDLSEEGVGAWEPNYDTELWKHKGVLSVYVQKVVQVDLEGKAEIKPTPVQVLEYKF